MSVRVVVFNHLKTLKLPTVLREYLNLASQFAAEGLKYIQFLARLVELELELERARCEWKVIFDAEGLNGAMFD